MHTYTWFHRLTLNPFSLHARLSLRKGNGVRHKKLRHGNAGEATDDVNDTTTAGYDVVDRECLPTLYTDIVFLIICVAEYIVESVLLSKQYT